MIRSPYNFISLEEKVFIPDWTDQISHDIPFSDGVSGKITLEMEAKTPVFVRNGQVGSAVDNSFSRTDGNRYFIPGTSIKGAIRNVLEIVSHGKMRTNKNQLFAQREWGNTHLYDLRARQTSFRCGWLKWDNDKGYHIVDCGTPYRIGHDRIDDFLGRDLFRSYFSRSNGIDLNRQTNFEGTEYDPKTARFKYALVDQLGISLDNRCFEIDTEHNATRGGFTRVKVTSESNKQFEGTIVFTGQPDKWEYPRPRQLQNGAGKFYDFVFKSPGGNARIEQIEVDEFESYQAIYKESPDWKYWYDKIDSSGIPVFFMKEKGQKLKWGLALLFKLPYDNTPFETLYDSHKTEKYDLSDCIFGSVGKDNSLKGRVSFGHAFCVSENVEPMAEVRLVLSSPKASYYPTYISQSGNNGRTEQYQTYNDGRISGWKRYVVRENVWTPAGQPMTANGQNVSDKIYTVFRPLPGGTKFVSTIAFHNLKPEELGALLSALTFHGCERECYHQLGQGKPYGYGRVKIIPKIEVLTTGYQQFDSETYMAKFEKMLHKEGMRVNVAQLIAMASELKSDSQYEYMNLSMDGNSNEFQQAKNNKEYLEPFVGVQQLPSWGKNRSDQLKEMEALSQEVKNAFNEKLRKMQEELQRQKDLEEQRRKEQEAERLKIQQLEAEANMLFVNKNYTAAFAKYQEIYNMTEDETALSKIKECEEKLSGQMVSLSEYLKSVKVSSIPAFATGLQKKWMIPNDKSVLDEDELKTLTDFLSGVYLQLSSKDQKKWNNVKAWDNLRNLLGLDIFCRIIK